MKKYPLPLNSQFSKKSNLLEKQISTLMLRVIKGGGNMFENIFMEIYTSLYEEIYTMNLNSILDLNEKNEEVDK